MDITSGIFQDPRLIVSTKNQVENSTKLSVDFHAEIESLALSMPAEIKITH
jgi:hypothetical protein